MNIGRDKVSNRTLIRQTQIVFQLNLLMLLLVRPNKLKGTKIAILCRG